MDNPNFHEYLRSLWPGLATDTYEKLDRFRNWVISENEKQNLTRLTEPKDFVEGHILDVRAVFDSCLVQFPAMDLGSGGGVPGLIAAILRSDPWVLVDAEARKADYLARSISEFGIQDHARVFSGRGEAFLKENQVSSVVARAVGPVERIYSWIRGCSTWNNLVLLKGPSWEEEWASFQQSKFRKDLVIDSVWRYEVGSEKKKRLIVRLNRVPRRTQSERGL